MTALVAGQVRADAPGAELPLAPRRASPQPSGAALGAPLSSLAATPVRPIINRWQPLTLVLVGVSAAALTTAAIAGFTARGHARELTDGCAPTCDPGAVSATDTRRLIAHVGLGVGLAAGAAAVWSFVGRDRPMSVAVGPPPKSAPSVIALFPHTSGAMVSWRARF